MLAEQRVVLCMRELRRPCDCRDELRCPPHTTYHDMEAAIAALSEDGIWVNFRAEEKKPDLRTWEPWVAIFWSSYALVIVSFLAWIGMGVWHRA